MTRLYTNGAEESSMDFFDYSSSVSISSSSPISGNYSYITGDNSSAFRTNSPRSELYFRYRILCNSTSHFVYFRKDTTTLLGLTMNRAMSRFDLSGAVTGSTSNGSSNFSNTLLVEVYYKVGDVDGRVMVKVDGVLCYDSGVTDTKPGTDSTVDNVVLYTANGGTSKYDDIALNDTLGSYDNSWCGNGRVVAALKPDSSAGTNQWINISGTSINNYDYINHIPAIDTLYLYTTVSGNAELNNVETYTLTSGEYIARVIPVIRAKNDAGDSYITFGVRSNGIYATDTLPVSTSFKTIYGTSLPVDPDTGLMWTQSALDSVIAYIKAE